MKKAIFLVLGLFTGKMVGLCASYTLPLLPLIILSSQDIQPYQSDLKIIGSFQPILGNLIMVPTTILIWKKLTGNEYSKKATITTAIILSFCAIWLYALFNSFVYVSTWAMWILAAIIYSLIPANKNLIEKNDLSFSPPD